MSYLTELFEKHVAADVKFVVKSQPIGAHVDEVAPFSPVMAAMLDNDRFQEGQIITVHIDDMEPYVFKEIVRYLYTGTVPQLEQMTESLFVAADRFQIQGIAFLCPQRMLSKLNKENAFRYLVLAHLHSLPELAEKCYHVIESNRNDLGPRRMEAATPISSLRRRVKCLNILSSKLT